MNLATLAEGHLERIWRAARAETRDDEAAWDCVQEAFATALSVDRDVGDENTVAWLCGVAKNHARHWIRGMARRNNAHERLADRQGKFSRGAVDKVALHDALAKLPVKQRDAVMLRYLTGRTFPEVAEAQGISEAAAKARVRRGLAALRLHLGAAATAVLLVREASAGGLEMLAAATVGFTMKKYLVLALLLLALFGVSVPFWLDRGDERPERRTAERTSASRNESATQPGSETTEVATAPLGGARYPAQRPAARLIGGVMDDKNERMPGVTVRVRSTRGGFHPALEVPDDRALARTLVTDRDGEFGCDLVEGPYVVEVSADDGRRDKRRLILPAASPVWLVLKHRHVQDFKVRVVDPDDVPVAGAHVEVLANRAADALPSTYRSTTDAEGCCVVPGLDAISAVVRAKAQDGRTGWRGVAGEYQLRTLMDAGGVKVTIDRAGVLTGTLDGVSAATLKGAVIVAHARTNRNPYYGGSGWRYEAPVVKRQYRFESLPAGPYSLTLRSKSGARLVLPSYFEGDYEIKNSVGLATADVVSGATTVRDLDVAVGGSVSGRVLSETRPVADARVTVTFAPFGGNMTEGNRLHGVHVWRLDARPSHWSRHPEVRRVAVTGPDGRYELNGLHPGTHRVEVFADGLSYDRRMSVEVADGENAELLHDLLPAGVLQVATNSSYIGLTRAAEVTPFWIAIVPGHGFTLPGLAAGVYDVAAYHSDPSRGKSHLKRVRIEAGRTTWADLRGEGPIRIRGRVLTTAGPLSGVSVVAGARPSRKTGPTGDFEVRSTFPWTSSVLFRVRVEGLIWRFNFQPMKLEDTEWQGELRLGEHAVTVRAVDADNAPARASLRVRSTELTRKWDGTPRLNRSQLRTDARGEVQLRHLVPGSYSGDVRFANGVSIPLRFVVPATEPIILRAPRTGKLVVTVRDAKNRPVAGAPVTVQVGTGKGDAPAAAQKILGNAARMEGKTDGNGEARFDATAVGAAIVSTSDPLVSSFMRKSYSTRVEIVAGATAKARIQIGER
jgi:RNA polymerase sigma-70 factor (ECF subfamily)